MAASAVSPERHDTVALAWVKAPILDCLGQARQALERFASEPGDPAMLAFFVDNLHQVQGCLRMLELRGAAHLAEELELLGRAMADGQVSPRGDCLGALFRGLEQLPPYLERLRGSRHDLPLVVVPLLNQLRGCRGVEPLPQGSLVGGVAQRLAGAADLADLDLSLGNWREHLQAGHGRDALRSVVTALCDDLMRIKDRLDQYMRGDREQREQLEALLAPLRQVADTLAVLAFQQPRRVIIDQVLVLQALAQGEQAVDDAVLMDVAGALLYVEATLNGMVGPLEETGQGGLPGADLTEIRQLVLNESLAVLQQAKDLIGDCLESGWPAERLQPLPGLLHQIRGALTMLMWPEAAEVFGGCAGYVQGWLSHLEQPPPADELAHLAEALSAGECYVQWRVADPLVDAQPFIDRARASLAALGVSCGQAEARVEFEAVDEELRDVFLEEAGELLPEIERHWLRWRADNALREALVEVRRALHTLKGSGRMVHAEALAELAWGAEHLLNRVLEGRITLGAEGVLALQQVFVRLPDLLADFAVGHLPSRVEVEPLAGHLHHLAINDVSAPAQVDGLDPQLLAIFGNEAQGHLASLETFLRDADGHGTPVNDSLQRALHTLKGSAAMAGVMPIAELATAFDRLVREYKGHELPLQVAELEWLEAARALFHLGLAQLGSTPLAPIPGAAQLIEEVGQSVDVRLAFLQQDPQHSHRPKRDPQRIAAFLTQGMDILLEAEALLSRWQAQPGDRSVLETLLDELTTLGQSAYLAELWQVDEVCEALLDLYGAVEEGSLAASPRFFALAQQAHEALLDMFDEIAAGQALSARVDCIAAMRGLLDDALDPGIMGVVGQDAVAPLAVYPTANNPALVQLFLDEAGDILDGADQALAQWAQDPDNHSALSTLQHDLQTLKGGAQMAGVGAVEVLAHALVALYEGLVDRRLGATAELLDLLRRGHQTLGQMLHALREGQAPASATALLGELREYRHAPPAPAAVEAAADEAQRSSDNELLEVFLEESSDIVESAAAALARWQADPRNSVEVENLLRDLHTLKGGARMVEIAAIGDLAHELEFLYELLAAGRLPPSPALFSLLQNCHDRLAHMLDAVRLGQPLHAATALIDYIRNFSSAALTDSAAGQVPVEAPSPEAPAAAPERAPGDMVKVDAELLDDLGNLASEHSVIRGRIEQQVNDAQFALNEMETTLERMRDQLLRLDIETQGRMSSRYQAEGDAYEDFDPLEMDRHSQLQQLSQALFESASDLLDLKETLAQRAQEAYSLLQQQARVNSQLQEGLTATLMVPFERLVPRLQRVVRQVASELGKQVELVVGNAEGELDRSVLERMVAPLEHMLRNAVDHGLESREARLAAGKPEQGTIHLNLLHEGADIVIEMSDDGAGVPLEAVRNKAIKRGLLDPQAYLSDHEILQFILRPGFSTAEKITQISGRGLGMDVVHEEVKQLGGSMSIESSPGKGARFLIRLPFTVSVNRALMVHLGEEQYAIPLNTIEGIVRVPPAELEACYQLSAPRYAYAGHEYDLRYLGEVLQGGVPRPSLLGQSVPLPVLLVHSQEQSFAIQVDSLSPSREIVVKSLGPQFAAVPGLSGATLLGDGRVVLILDLLGQLRGQQRRLARLPGGYGGPRPVFGPAPRQRLLVMVVDDSVTVRKVTSRLLERHGMSVLTAKDGVDAMALLEEHRPDVLLLDIEMPRMDGFEVATRIRRDVRLKDLPIIMITSRTGQKHRDRAMAIGVNDYLGKPYQESVLLQSIAHWSQPHA
ncbi:Hpt domain-containing protein [Pseudomonas sp. ESBL1]|uniref:Hpt domain-containing protein n=1 Tax=Pseudomonas sp. ESBL1 TaxID=3077324 RepID=UPI002FC60B03